MVGRTIRIIFTILLACIIVGTTAWATLALWYRLPVPEVARYVASGLFALFGCGVIIALFRPIRFRALAVFVGALAVLLIWWSTIKPVEHADWAADVSRQVTGKFDGDILTLTNVRDFEWRNDTDFTERWTTRTYDMSKLRSLDLFMSYWAGPEIAHMMLSFGFEGDAYVAWSIEVRRKKGGEYSPIADLFKTDPLVIFAADERDVVGVRSNVRGEDVQLYRLRTSPEEARRLLREYVLDANALAKTPKFYNSITTNCTTVVVKMMRAVGDRLPLDWRLLANGYLPEYAYDQGALDSRHSLTDLKALAHIDKRARKAGLTPDYSRIIRVGVPSPHK